MLLRLLLILIFITGLFSPAQASRDRIKYLLERAKQRRTGRKLSTLDLAKPKTAKKPEKQIEKKPTKKKVAKKEVPTSPPKIEITNTTVINQVTPEPEKHHLAPTLVTPEYTPHQEKVIEHVSDYVKPHSRKANPYIEVLKKEGKITPPQPIAVKQKPITPKVPAPKIYVEKVKPVLVEKPETTPKPEPKHIEEKTAEKAKSENIIYAPERRVVKPLPIVEIKQENKVVQAEVKELIPTKEEIASKEIKNSQIEIATDFKPIAEHENKKVELEEDTDPDIEEEFKEVENEKPKAKVLSTEREFSPQNHKPSNKPTDHKTKDDRNADYLLVIRKSLKSIEEDAWSTVKYNMGEALDYFAKEKDIYKDPGIDTYYKMVLAFERFSEAGLELDQGDFADFEEAEALYLDAQDILIEVRDALGDDQVSINLADITVTVLGYIDEELEYIEEMLGL